MIVGLPDSPYKYLNHYDFEDKDIFFGREPEILTLLADIVVSRLVVLFAKTGTGKTSLINAGVRPRLEERDYKTFWVRVRRDPVESLRKELGFNRLTQANLVDELERLSRETYKMPIVLFFDQFEEFFTYIKADSPEGRKFISDVAELYENHNSSVHIVFSMREEWFVELDAFRDKIPTIFHNESNLRLRWFNESQAQEAIKRPAEKFGVIIDADLVEKLVDDLSEDGLIEPAQLQIACDALWREGRQGNRITLERYRQLGHKGTEPNIARQILYNRLEDEFEKIETEEQLLLLHRLLPQLRTPPPRSIKYVRDILSLVKDLNTDKESLWKLVRLLENSQLIRTSIRDELPVVELLHDYLVGYLEQLAVRVKAIWPRRILRLGQDAYARNGELILHERLDKILTYVRDADVRKFILRRSESELLFRSSLESGSNMSEWFVFASEHGADVWGILDDALRTEHKAGRDYLVSASNAIDLLGELLTRELHGEKAAELLGKALANDLLALTVVKTLERYETIMSTSVLEKALQKSSIAPHAHEVLEKFANSRKNVNIASEAHQILTRYVSTKEHGKTESSREEKPAKLLDTAFLEVHCRAVISALLDNRVIPFFGRDVNRAGRPPGATWRKGDFLPTDDELSMHLADRFKLPPQLHDLSSVAQFISEIYGARWLYDEVHDALSVPHPFNPVYRFFAFLSRTLRERGYLQRTHPLRNRLIMVTANYDNALENALNEAGEKYHVISYVPIVRNSGRLGTFHHISPDGERFDIEVANEYGKLARDSYPIILKINGSLERRGAGENYQPPEEYDSFVISEDDYIRYYMNRNWHTLLPTEIVAKLRRSNYLFLGYSTRSWHTRTFIYSIWNETALSYKSWAINQQADEREARWWNSRGVELIDMVVEDYITELRERM